jgi:hypothetical protein
VKWPWVSRVRFELLEHNFSEARVQLAAAKAERDRADAQLAWMSAQYCGLLEKYHALRVMGDEAPAPTPAVAFDEPEQPPVEVLAAMQQISPQRDKTYEANWAHWERNKARAAQYPKEFAEEIIMGAVFDGTETRH